MKKNDLYKMKYPDVLPWRKRIFLLKEGDKLTKEGKTYLVKQVIHSSLEEQPRIVLELL